MKFVCFKGSLLFRLEPHELLNKFSNLVDGTMSVSTFQFIPSIEVDSASVSKVFTIFVNRSVLWICDLTSSSLLIHFVNLYPHLLRLSLTFWWISIAS